MEVRKKENENIGSLIFRFIKKVQQTGILREAKKRRFYKRRENRLKRKLSALHREEKKREMSKARKMGELYER